VGILSPAAFLRLLTDMIAVVILAPLIPVILVVAVILAIYGDITKKRNRWTGLEFRNNPRSSQL
jgi:hypothetical protein